MALSQFVNSAGNVNMRFFECMHLDMTSNSQKRNTITHSFQNNCANNNGIYLQSVRALVETIERRDPYIQGHSRQVSELALEIAHQLDFTQHVSHLIELAGMLHDIGKIAIPEVILKKATTLNKQEWVIIKKHPQLGVSIIEPINKLRPIQTWILYHHERWDGSGYPEGRKNCAIPIHARILAICDTFSAMTSDRPYRRALSIQRALQEIKAVSGSQLDPHIASLFVRLIKKNLSARGLGGRNPRKTRSN